MRAKRNSIYGLLSVALPTAVLLAAYPVLIHGLGADVVGIYLLATNLSGAWLVFDFGVSAATLKFVAEDVAADNRRAAANIVVTSLVFYGVVSTAA